MGKVTCSTRVEDKSEENLAFQMVWEPRGASMLQFLLMPLTLFTIIQWQTWGKTALFLDLMMPLVPP